MHACCLSYSRLAAIIMHYISLFVVFLICGPEDNNNYYKSDTII